MEQKKLIKSQMNLILVYTVLLTSLWALTFYNYIISFFVLVLGEIYLLVQFNSLKKQYVKVLAGQ